MAGHERIADGVLLIEEARRGAFFLFVPCTPCAHDHPDALLRVISIHDLAVSFDDLFDLPASAHELEPLSLAILGGVAFPGDPIAKDGVMVDVEAVHHVGSFAHHHLGPVVVITCGAGSDAERPDVLVRRQERSEATVEVGIVLWEHVDVATHDLVTPATVKYMTQM